jgi:hypothetical protein
MHYLIRFTFRISLFIFATIVFVIGAIVEFAFYFQIPLIKDAIKHFKEATYKEKLLKRDFVYQQLEDGRLQKYYTYKMTYYKNIFHWLCYHSSYCIITKQQYDHLYKDY